MSHTPHDTILISLPYPFRFLTLKRKIGFTFTNLYKYLLFEGNGCRQMSELKKEKSENEIRVESLYYAAVAYCQLNRKRENFTKEGLRKAIALADQETHEKILKVWWASETFGATVKPSKKKVELRTPNMMRAKP